MKSAAAFLIFTVLFALCPARAEERRDDTAEFRRMLKNRIIEVLESWPAEDQYAIMFFIYPNECYEYGGRSNIPEFVMLYKCESEMAHNANPVFTPIGEEEARWNPAFWDYDKRQTVIGFDEINPAADALMRWYEDTGVKDIGYEEPDSMYDSHMAYIGKGPNGLSELLGLAADIAAELQSSGYIEARFGRKLPIILADYEFTWYMIKATRDANPDGEADAYIDACLRNGWANEEQIR